MAEVARKIGVFCSQERRAYYEQMLRVRDILSCSKESRLLWWTGSPEQVDWRGALAEWDKAGIDVAVVDDASFKDKEAMVAGLGYFLSAPRVKAGRLRPIFVADVRRTPTDEVFVRLASSGLYDLVIPGRDVSLAEKLCDLVCHPARRSDVSSLIKTTPLYEVATSAQLTVAQPSPRQQLKYAARGKSVIAVAGIMPRAGATNCSIVVARTLALLGQAPALVVDKRAGSGFQKGYRCAAAPDGKSFRINGIDIYCDEPSAAIPRRYSHVIMDVGYISWGSKERTPEEQQKAEEFARADLQIVYVPCVSPADFEYLSRFFEEQSQADLERYAIGIWGATTELFEMLQQKFRAKAPHAFMWNVQVYRWPLSLNSLSTDMVEVLRPVLPRGVAAKALKKLQETGEEVKDE